MFGRDRKKKKKDKDRRRDRDRHESEEEEDEDESPLFGYESELRKEFEDQRRLLYSRSRGLQDDEKPRATVAREYNWQPELGNGGRKIDPGLKLPTESKSKGLQDVRMPLAAVRGGADQRPGLSYESVKKGPVLKLPTERRLHADAMSRAPVLEDNGRRQGYRLDGDARMQSGATGYQARSAVRMMPPPPPQDIKSRKSANRDKTKSVFRKLHDKMSQGEQTERTSRPANENPVTASKKIVMAAIDFGTTYSGYAFSFKHEYNTDPLKMHANAWTNVGQGNMNSKTPTCLLLEPNMKLHSFGNEAKDKYQTLLEENQHRDWYFFKEFKMTLHQKQEIKGNYELTEENGKKLDALTVFNLSIQALKNHLMTVLRNGYSDVSDDDVMWIITVPAIWNDSAKKFMRKAAEKAGIDKDSIDIALEPEAASIFCRQLPITRDPQTETGMTKFPVGTRYMVLDCGGGTVDVTVHEVLDNNNLKELHKATGGNWGGTVVNKAFIDFVSNYVGPIVFDEFCENHRSDYMDLLNEFETKKRMAPSDSTDKVTLRIPTTLQRLFQDASSCPPSEQSKQRSIYQNRVTTYSDKLRMDADLFKSFFNQAVWDITTHVGDLMESLPRPIQAILMVGGFSDCPILQRAVKTSFDDKVEVIVPMEASLCVMKGAVLYGHQPLKITERKSRYTYGVSMTVPYVKGKYPKNRKIISDGEEWCDNVFDKHVETGQTVKTNEAQATRTYYPMSTSDRFLPVHIFRSTDTNPGFVDEENCDFVDLFKVQRKPGTGETTKQDAIKVRFIFGGSDIKVEALKSDGSVQSAEFAMQD